MLGTNVLLGGIAGITIFIGLLIARWRGATERLRGLLALASAGVLLFLVIEVGYHAMASVESAALGGSTGTAAWQGLIFVAGLVVGLVGLAFWEERRMGRRAAVAQPLEVATMIAIGIGLHNFAEGLAIGQSFGSGALGFGTVLVVGFALHNATEGFGIAGPLVGEPVTWSRLLWLGVVGGGPTIVGAAVGGLWVNRSVELLFLSLATGSLVYVTRELFRLRFPTLRVVAAMTSVLVGFLIGFGTELVTEVAQSRALAFDAAENAKSVRFVETQVTPSSLSLKRGQVLAIENAGSFPLIFEGNGLYVGEVVVPPGGKVAVSISGSAGQYRLADERGQSGAATIVVDPGTTVEPLTDEVNAVGALVVLEGHVRASKELHDRGVSGQGPNPMLDLKRAGKHAGHPQRELLEGNEPDALNLQRLLRSSRAFDSLNDALTAYINVSGDATTPKEDIEQKYRATLAATEQARRAIAGNAYNASSFQTRVAKFAMDTAAGEYRTATEGGRVSVLEPGTPGKDNYIEYQDARGFLAATYDLLRSVRKLSPEADAAFEKLRTEIFATLDPPDPNKPVPVSEVERLIRGAEDHLN